MRGRVLFACWSKVQNAVAALRVLRSDARASINVLGVLSMPLTIGSLAVAVELGNGHAVRVENQSVADMAALAAAQVYTKNSSLTAAQKAAADVTAAAGLPSSAVVASLVSAPDGSGAQAIRAVVTTTVPYYLGRFFTNGTSYSVDATSFAKFVVNNSVTPCLLALATSGTPNQPYTVSAEGGSNIVATNCSIQSNKEIYANGGSNISARSMSAVTTAAPAVNSGSSITTTPTANNIVTGAAVATNPLSGNAAIAGGLNKVTNITTLMPAVQTPPTLPANNSGTDFKPGWWPTTFEHTNAAGTKLAGSYNSGTSTWTFPAGTYDIKDLEVAGGQRLVFTGPVTLNISGNIIGTGMGLTIGAGQTNTVRIRGNVTTSGGSFLTMGNGEVAVNGHFNVQSPVTIGNGRHYFSTIGGSSNAATAANFIVGTGDVDVNGTIRVGGGFTVRFGAGNYVFKKSNGQSDAINIGGGGTFQVGDGTFSVDGSITGQGSGTMIFGATPNHYINGNLTLAGNATFGAGTYIIAGNLINNTTGTMAGSNVSFVLSGYLNLGGSANLNIQASSDGTGGSIADFLFITNNSTNTVITAGTTATLRGISYTPNSRVSITSGGNITGTCWSLVAQSVNVSNGARTTTTGCAPLAPNTPSGTTIRLVR